MRVPERAAEVAQLHAEKVANLIKVVGNQQVQLEVKFAEVSRSGLRNLGINFFHQDAGGRFLGGITNPGQAIDAFTGVPGTGGAQTPGIQGPPGSGFSLFFSGLPSFPFSAVLNVLEQSGLAKMLAEPTLVALSGQEAKFLVGGEFPVPMSSSLGAISVLWKKFGIILNFTPTVIADGALHLKLSAEVSDVDPTRSVTIGGISIPGLTSRQSETTVRLADGQSFAIAGLLSDKIQSTVSKIPLLGRHPDPGRAVPLGELPAQRDRAAGGGHGAPGQAGGAARCSPPADRERAQRPERRPAVPASGALAAGTRTTAAVQCRRRRVKGRRSGRP